MIVMIRPSSTLGVAAALRTMPQQRSSYEAPAQHVAAESRSLRPYGRRVVCCDVYLLVLVALGAALVALEPCWSCELCDRTLHHRHCFEGSRARGARADWDVPCHKYVPTQGRRTEHGVVSIFDEDGRWLTCPLITVAAWPLLMLLYYSLCFTRCCGGRQEAPRTVSATMCRYNDVTGGCSNEECRYSHDRGRHAARAGERRCCELCPWYYACVAVVFLGGIFAAGVFVLLEELSGGTAAAPLSGWT